MIIDNHTLGINLIPCIYKMILKLLLEVEDLKDVDIELFTSLQQKHDEATFCENSKSAKNSEKKEDEDTVFFTLDIGCEDEKEEAIEDVTVSD